MKLSMTLASLGLCVAPAFADPIGFMVFTSNTETWLETPVSDGCLPNWEEQNPLNEMYLKGNVTGAAMECFFYQDKNKECMGSSTTLEEGLHQFSGDFYTTSFKCLNTRSA